MNYELLRAHIAQTTHADINPSLSKDSKNVGMFYMSSAPLEMKGFMLNYGGYPRNEIAMINEQENEVVAQQLLARLTVLPEGDNPNSGLSDAEIMLSHRSKYCQTSSEQIEFIDSLLEKRNARIAEYQRQKAEFEAKKNEALEPENS